LSQSETVSVLPTSRPSTAAEFGRESRAWALPPAVRQVWAIAWKDVRAELRSRQVLASTVVFALLVLIIFNFSLDLSGTDMAEKGPAVLWVAILLAAVLGLNHVFGREREHGALEGFVLLPVDRTVLYFGKFLGALALTAAMEAGVVPVFAVLTNQGGLFPIPVLALALGTLGFLAVGTLFSAISVNVRTREMLLPILLLPIAVPVLLAGVQATQLALEGKPWADITPWLATLAIFDGIYLVMSPILFEYVVEELGS